jgi:hypothetical protein
MGHWTSHALSLIFVQFCQLQGFIGELQVTGDEKINGWSVQYTIVDKPAPQCGLEEFLMVC